MPELPEVEITRRGIAPAITGKTVTAVKVRNASLRWPVPANLAAILKGHAPRDIARRGKYLLFDFDSGSLIIHLGMSGSLRLVPLRTPVKAHDHVDLEFGETVLRLRDPRRFGAVLWTAGKVQEHPLLAHLGAEPLDAAFTGETLHRASRGRSAGIKQLLMDHRVVVGVGNIYANESLFRARIHPLKPSGRVTLARYERLAEAIRTTLLAALAAGGSSLRDFVHSDGASGYFQQQYFVYDRESEPCRVCAQPVRMVRQGQRSTFYCAKCQH